MVHDKDAKHIACLCRGTDLWYIDRKFEGQYDAEAGAKVGRSGVEPIAQIWKAKELVVNTCASDLSIEKSYLRLQEYRRLVFCEEYYACFWGKVTSLAGEYTKLILSPESDIGVILGVSETSKAFTRAMAPLPFTRRLVAVLWRLDLLQ